MPNAFPHPALYLRDEEGESPYAPSPTPATPPAFAIDPAILREETGEDTIEYAYSEQEEPQLEFSSPLDMYASDPAGSPPSHAYTRDGPQGPPPEPILYPDPEEYEEAPPRPLKKQRRLKRPRREPECSFCQGNDEKNKDAVPETMLSCSNCGRSGHPTCLDISQIVDIVFGYPWTCIECKPCEICRGKGDDTKLLFCDYCDRGWHYDCLNPPLDGPPEGNWNCPLCPPLTEIPIASSSRSEEPQPEFDETQYSETFQEEEPTVRSNVKSKGKSKARPRNHVIVPATRLQGLPAKRARAHQTDSSSAARPEARVTFRLRLSGPKGKGRERREDDDLNKSPFEGVLAPEELDTSKTCILSEDKARFERSRIAAENKLARAFPPLQPPTTPGPSSSQPLMALPFRPLRSVAHLLPSTPQPSDPSSSTSASISTPYPASPTPASSSAATSTPLRIRTIRFGQYDIDTWYDAPFPEEYNNTPDGRLWMCEFCLKYMKSGFGAARHLTKCKARHPPGDEIYRDGAISVFEVDGRKNKIYCQNLCLLSKMFLDHKSLFYDVEPFLFYVMTEVDEGGARFVGYFSKEKRSPKDFNVSCIMTLPVRQRRGWGNLLIDFSYLLSKKEGRVGSPERPLSALGALSYRNYWTLAVMTYLETAPDHVTLESISKSTSMMVQDILATLKEQNIIIVDDRPSSPLPRSPAGGKNRPRGRPHSSFSRRLTARKVPTKEDSASEPLIPTSYKIQWRKEVVDDYLAKWRAKGYLALKPNRLKWSPYLLARTPKLDSAAPQAVAASQVTSVIPQTESTAGTSVRGDDTTMNPSRSASPMPQASPSRLARELAELDVASPMETRSRGTIDNDGDDAAIATHMRSSQRLRRGSSNIPHQGPRTRATRSRSSLRRSVSSIVDDEPEENPARTPARDPAVVSEPLSRTRSGGIRPVTRTSPRKRRRIESSPDSSGLSEPPTTPERSLSPPPTSRLRIMNGHAHENDHGYSIPRQTRAVTRSSSGPTSAILAHSTNGNSNGISLRGRRASSRLNGSDQHGPFIPLLDDPEEALRIAKKARPLATRTPKKAHVVAVPLLKEDGVDMMGQVGFAMNGIEIDFVGDVTNGTAHLTNGFTSIEDDLGDLDAEGEEEVLDAVNGGMGVGDEDAEGEEDLDAEGEPEP